MSARQSVRQGKSAPAQAALIAFVGGASPPTPPRWTCHHRVESSNIEAYVLAADGLRVIAETRAAPGIDAHANAELIVRAVNCYERSRPLIAELVSVLDMCRQSGTLTPDALREIEIVCGKAKMVLGQN